MADIRPVPMRERRLCALAIAAIAAVVAFAYSDALRGPFVLDDPDAILANLTLRHGWSAWRPPTDATVGGRPVLNLALAANFAFGRTAPMGYHIGNVLIHCLAAMAMFGLVRRILFQMGEEWAANATALAAVSALLWAAHPLQTEAVTYVVQRAESLMGLFYLLTLYGYVRYAAPDAGVLDPGRGQRLRLHAKKWAILSIAACLLGVGTKEVMVSAPLMALVIDGAFLSGSYRAAWSRHRAVLLALFATWIPLGLLVASTHGRNGTAGFGLGISVFRYWRTQAAGVLHYLRLAVWPAGQVFDYGSYWIDDPARWIPAGVVVLALFAAVLWALRRRPRLGAPGLWFFAILAPTSLIPGMRQTLAEHRMYLALAPLAVLATVALWKTLGRAGFLAAAVLIVAFATVAYRRNLVYRTALGLWADTLAKRPDDIYALNNYGSTLLHANRVAAAEPYFERALAIQPDFVDALVNAANVAGQAGDRSRERRLLLRALAVQPDNPYAQNNYSNLLEAGGNDAEAARRLAGVLARAPGYAEGRNDYGNALLDLGRVDEAAAQYAAALAIDPEFAPAYNGLGEARFREGRIAESRADFALALRWRPHYSDAEANDAEALARLGEAPAALAEYARAAADGPEVAGIRFNYANLLLQTGRIQEAIAQYAAATRLDPGFAKAHFNYGVALYREGATGPCAAEMQRAVDLAPGWAEAHNNLGAVLILLHRPQEAVAQIEAALRLDPRVPGAAANLAAAKAALAHSP